MKIKILYLFMMVTTLCSMVQMWGMEKEFKETKRKINSQYAIELENRKNKPSNKALEDRKLFLAFKKSEPRSFKKDLNCVKRHSLIYETLYRVAPGFVRFDELLHTVAHTEWLLNTMYESNSFYNYKSDLYGFFISIHDLLTKLRKERVIDLGKGICVSLTDPNLDEILFTMNSGENEELPLDIATVNQAIAKILNNQFDSLSQKEVKELLIAMGALLRREKSDAVVYQDPQEEQNEYQDPQQNAQDEQNEPVRENEESIALPEKDGVQELDQASVTNQIIDREYLKKAYVLLKTIEPDREVTALLAKTTSNNLQSRINGLIADSEYLLKSFSEREIQKVRSAHDTVFKNPSDVKDYRTKLDSLYKELGIQQSKLQATKDKKAPQPRNQTNQKGGKNPQYEVFMKQKNQDMKDIAIEKQSIESRIYDLKKKYGIINLSAALNAFLERTEHLTLNRCWISLNLGRFDCNVHLGRFDWNILTDIVGLYEKNIKLKEFIKNIFKAFRTSGNDKLFNGFLDCFQSYVLGAFSNNAQREAEAKGFLWEMAVAGFLLETQKNSYRSMNTEVENTVHKNVFCVFDHALENCYIECKDCACFMNLQYNTKAAEFDKATKQLLRERNIAESNKKAFVLISKNEISKEVAQWLKEERISYICPKNCTNTILGDASTLYKVSF